MSNGDRHGRLLRRCREELSDYLALVEDHPAPAARLSKLIEDLDKTIAYRDVANAFNKPTK